MVEDLIRRARHRFLFNETFAQSAFAAAVVIGGFALLLIVGTRYMEWWTLAIFAAVGIASEIVHARFPNFGFYGPIVAIVVGVGSRPE